MSGGCPPCDNQAMVESFGMGLMIVLVNRRHISAVLDAHSITIASDGLLGRMPLAMALYAVAVGSDAV